LRVEASMSFLRLQVLTLQCLRLPYASGPRGLCIGDALARAGR
jgi:hypothetical protein